MKKSFLLAFLFLTTVTGFSQVKQVAAQSVEAYKNKDYALFLKLTKQMDSLRPSHPNYMYNLAAAYSLNKMEPEAITALRNLLLMNNTVPFEIEPDFEFIKNSEGFQKLKDLKAAQGKVIENSTFKLSLSEKDLHPEGLLYLEKQKLWLASSIRNKKIVSFDHSGKCSDWFTDSHYSVFAMKADAKEQYLWVTTSAMSVMKGYSDEMEGKNEILKIDIKTRKVVKRYTVDGKHVFGDLLLAKNGDVYLSDSVDPLIYKIADDKVTLWKDLKHEAFNLQGMVFNSDESQFFIADYLKGILAVSMKDISKTSWLKFPDGATKKGIDGLVFYKNALIGIHNGTKPIRVVKYDLNSDNTQITGFSVLDNNRKDFNEPALATVSKGKLYYFANSPWNFYDAKNDLDATKFENPKLFQLQLDK